MPDTQQTKAPNNETTKGVLVGPFVDSLKSGIDKLHEALNKSEAERQRITGLSIILGEKWEEEELESIGLSEDDIKILKP